MLTEKLMGIIVIACCGALLTMARRYKNPRRYGVAGWTDYEKLA